MYREYVLSSPNPENVQLLIPEYRYGGLDRKHKYRLDFTIIDPHELSKLGFELSPWSTHGYLSKTKGMSQKEINEVARDNFEREMRKHKDYFWEHGVFVLIYTDSELASIKHVFKDMQKYLNPTTTAQHIQYQIIEEMLGPEA